MRYIAVLILGCILLPMTNNPQTKVPLLFIDTGNNDSYIYKNFFALSDSVGFSPFYKHFYDIKPETIEEYSAIFIAFDGNFFIALAQELNNQNTITNPLIKNFLTIIQHWSTDPDKLLGILFPSTSQASISLYNICYQLLSTWHVIDPTYQDVLEPLLKEFLFFLLSSDAQKSLHYHTALLPQKETSKTPKTFANIFDNNKNVIAQTLPMNCGMSQKCYPFGLYLKNDSTHHHFFLSKTSLIDFSGIKENFIFNPVDYTQRLSLLTCVQSSLHELYNALMQQSLKPCGIPLELPAVLLPQFVNATKARVLQAQNQIISKQYPAWIMRDGIWCAWTGLDGYAQKEEEAAQHILESGVNLLWIELRPEFYLGKNSILKKDKEQFLEKINRFTAALKKQCAVLAKEPPHIFVGIDITSNFSSTPVQHPVLDMYGKIYSKIPSPLDSELWQSEVIDPFVQFVNLWPQIGNEIPLGGVFLDLEMYHAQDQTAQYTNLMDFSDLAWDIFVKKIGKADLAHIYTTQKRVLYLLENNLMSDYFYYLQQTACDIGKSLKQQINQILPNGLIATYNINLPHEWFYNGFLAGLSCPQEPIIVATFNNDFYSHHSYLIQNKIYALHMPVILLSKFKKLDDFNLITQLAQYHNGIWLNRFERLEQSRNSQDWAWDYGVEVTPLDTAIVITEISKQIKQSKHFL